MGSYNAGIRVRLGRKFSDEDLHNPDEDVDEFRIFADDEPLIAALFEQLRDRARDFVEANRADLLHGWVAIHDLYPGKEEST